MIDWLNANQGFALALLTALYVIATIVLVAVSVRSNRLHAENTSTIVELEKLRNRPIVLLKIVITNHTFISVLLNNVGESTAFDVEVDIDPMLKRTEPIAEDEQISFLHNRTLSLPPKAELKSLVAYVKQLKEKHPDLTYEGKVRYKDKEDNHYSEPFRIDVSDQLDGIEIKRKTIHHVAENLEGIEKQLKRFVENRRTPLVRTIEEEVYKEEKRKEAEETRKHLRELKKQRQKKPDENEA